MGVERPDIRFTTAADGVEIAFWEIGAGPTLFLVQNRSLSHAELEWAVPSMAALYLELARYFRLVRFDPRGAGLSGEPLRDEGVALEGLTRDIDAVVDALHLDRINLAGAVSMGPSAVKHAVERPSLVERLVLCDTGPNLSDLPLNAYVRATDALVDLGVVPSLAGLFPSTPTDDLPAMEQLMKGSLYNRSRIEARDLRQFDVSSLLHEVHAPTLVIKSAHSLYTDLAETRRLTSGIPEAQMRIVPGTMAPWLADLHSVVEALVSFLTDKHHQPVRTNGDELRTVVFTDLVSSTEALTRLGDHEGRRVFRDIENRIKELCSTHRGQLIKNLGDGSLITFRSTQRAIAFSMDLQDVMVSSPLGVRIGIAAGEPIEEDHDVYGAVVVQASRIADLGDAGEILVSDSVRQLAVGKGFQFELEGEATLKGFDLPEHVWKVTKSAVESPRSSDC